MHSLNSAMRTVQQPLTAWRQSARPAGVGPLLTRPVAAAAAAQEYQASYDPYPGQPEFDGPPKRQYQQRGGRGGRGYRGNNSQRNWDDGGNAARYSSPRSFDEEGSGGDYNNYGRNRGGRGGRGGGGNNKRVLSPEAAAVNAALASATSWRQLNTILEQQSAAGMPGLDAFQLVDILMRLTRRDMVIPTEGDDLADFQQFVASVYGWLLERMPTIKAMQVCNAVSAIGRLNLYNAELLDAMLEVVTPLMTGFNASMYSKLLGGMAALNLVPSSEMQECLFTVKSADVIMRSLDRDNYRGHPLTDVGVIVSSCQRLGLSAPPEWLEIVAPGVVDALDGSDKVANMRTDLFVKLLVGLAGLGWQPSQQQWQVCATATQQMLPLGFFRARQLLETAWAFAQFGQPVSSEFSQAFHYQLFLQSRYLSPADISALLYSAALIKAKPNEKQLQRLVDNIKRSDQASGDDYVNVLLALAQFNYTPIDNVFDDTLIALSQQLSSCSPAGLGNIISALPSMGNGMRLKQVVDAAAARYDIIMAAQEDGAAPAADDQTAEFEAAAEQPVA